VTKAVPAGAKQETLEAGPHKDRLAQDDRASRRLHPTAKKILAAAKRILTRRGYQALTLQAIAAEAGVNKAGVWYYYGGKEQLVAALLESVAVTESHHFGARPAADATLDERVELIVGSAKQVKERVRRYAAFYELLPEASRDARLRTQIMTYYQGWYAWATEVLTPPDAAVRGRTSQAVGQFASVLLDGIFMQMVVAAPDFDLEAALRDARRALRYLLDPTTAGAARSL